MVTVYSEQNEATIHNTMTTSATHRKMQTVLLILELSNGVVLVMLVGYIMTIIIRFLVRKCCLMADSYASHSLP